MRIFSFLEVCKILANLKPFFPLNVFAGKKILYFLFISPLTITFLNSFLSARLNSTGNLEEFSLKVLIIFSFHSSLFNCQIPKNIVRIIQKVVKIKNFKDIKLKIYAPQI